MQDLFSASIEPAIGKARSRFLEIERPWCDIVGGFDPSDERAETRTIYTVYPFLFAEAFPRVDRRELVELGVACRLLAISAFAFDSIVDRECREDMLAATTLSGNAMRFEAHQILASLFPPGAPFWKRMRGYLTGEALAICREQEFALGTTPWSEFDEATARAIIVGKTGLANVPIAALGDLGGRPELLEPLEESIANYYLARQMWDDLCDWKRDARAGMPTLLLARVIPERTEVTREVVFEDLARRVYYDGHAQYVLELALEHAAAASRIPSELRTLPWCRVISNVRRTCEALLCDIGAIVERNRARARRQPDLCVRLPEAATPSLSLVRTAAEALIVEWRRGLGEAAPALRVPQYCRGDAFARAQVVAALTDLRSSAAEVGEVLAHGVGLLWQAARPGGAGWQYVEGLSIPVIDADVTAEAIAALAAVGDRSVDHAPAAGIGPDVLLQQGWPVSIIANVFYALHLAEGKRFAECGTQCARLLEEAQRPEGDWPANDAHPSALATYRCVRFLAAVRPGSEALARAASGLAAHQHPDGGWGAGEAGTPLATALAVLSLGLVDAPFDVDNALAYLTRTHDGARGWPAETMLRWRIAGAPSEYGSRTLTTSYVLRAAVVLSDRRGAR
jgi:squalene-hopene/tetraprenyl-beta-curcumene cyclase